MDSEFDDWFEGFSKERQDKMMHSTLIVVAAAVLFVATAFATLVYMLMAYAN